MTLPIIIIAGAILRLISLDQSFWLDEAVQVWAGQNFSLTRLITQYMPGDFNPPLYHLISHFWISIFGQGEVVNRLPSLLFGLGSILLIYRVARKIAPKNEKFALLSALLLATSPLHIYYSQENRMYMLASLAVLLALDGFLSLRHRPNSKKIAYFSLGLILVGMSHFLTLFVIPIFLAVVFMEIRKAKPKDKRIVQRLVPFIAFALSYLIYSPLLYKQLSTGMSWVEQFPVWKTTVGSFSLKAAALLPVKFIIGRITLENKILYGLISLLLVFLYWGQAILATIKSLKISKKKVTVKDKNIFLISCLLFFPPLLGLAISFFVPVFSYFRFLFILPFLYLLVSWQITSHKPVLKNMAVVLVSLNLVFSLAYLFYPKFHRENWRGAANWLHQQNHQYNAPVIVLDQIDKPFLFYNQGKGRIVSPSTKNIKKITKQGWPVLYLVSYGLPIFDPEDKIRATLRNNDYKITKGESFRQVGIEVWRKLSE